MGKTLLAVYYLWKREVTRFLRAKSRIIGTLGMPFFFLAILGTGIGGIVNMPGASGDYLDYITPGIVGFVLMMGSIFSGVIVIMDRQFGFLKETLVAPVNRNAIVIGKALGGATTALIQALLLVIASCLLGVELSLAGVLLAVPFMFLIAFMFVSLGIAFASVMEDMHGFQLIMNFIIMPMFFLSGAVFPLSGAPEIFRSIALIDPLVYAVDGLRFLLFGGSEFAFLVDFGVILALALVFVFTAAYLFGRIED